jgi:carboxylesterase type B
MVYTRSSTIFGESSGGSSVGYHLANSNSWGLFHRAIGESPGLTQVRSYSDAADNTEYLLALLAHNGSSGCTQQEDGPLRRFDQMRLESPTLAVLNDCQIPAATEQCANDSACLGFTTASVDGGQLTCTLHASGVPAYGGVRFANWTTYVKPAVMRGGAAEACLMQADAHAMVQAEFGTHSGPHTSDLVTDLWAPVVDGIELNSTMLAALQAGSLPPGVAVLMGANKDEASTWMHDLPPPTLACGSTSADELEMWSVQTFGPTVGHELPHLYTQLDGPIPPCSGKDNGKIDPLYTASSRMLRDYTIVCPIVRVLTAVKAAAFLYYFTVTPTFSINVPNTSMPHIGAFHGAEVPFVFNDTFELLTPGERSLSTLMGCFWSNFATSGDPNVGPPCGIDPLPKWPAWSADTGQAFVFNTTVRVINAFAAERCALLAKVVPPRPTV